jgi:transposase
MLWAESYSDHGEAMSSKFIRYEEKHGVQYATICYPQRANGKKINRYEYLGRVINKDLGLFKSRTRGMFAYTLQQEYITDEEVLASLLNQTPVAPVKHQEKLILDFGDAWLLSELLKTSTPLQIISQMIGDAFAPKSQSILALLYHQILSSTTHRHAQTWLDGSYASVLYPNANLRSQNITTLLRLLGNESRQRAFFAAYIARTHKNSTGILIDSTGLPNAIQFPLAANGVHGGPASRETRLILVVDCTTKLPLFFRYNAGNIVDVSTLTSTIQELQALGVETQYAIIDAGYYSQENIDALYLNKISFISRLGSNRTLYKKIVSENIDDIFQAKYLTLLNDRLVYIKKVPVELGDAKHAAFAYLAVDNQRKHTESQTYLKGAINDKVAADEIDAKLKNFGVFVLISSANIDAKDILGLYYTRQVVEQIFDLSKTDLDLVPLRTHNEETFRGHLMLTFLSSIVLLQVNRQLVEKKHCAIEAFAVMRNLKCKVYDNEMLVKEPTKKMKNIADLLQIKIPTRAICRS